MGSGNVDGIIRSGIPTSERKEKKRYKRSLKEKNTTFTHSLHLPSISLVCIFVLASLQTKKGKEVLETFLERKKKSYLHTLPLT